VSWILNVVIHLLLPNGEETNRPHLSVSVRHATLRSKGRVGGELTGGLVFDVHVVRLDEDWLNVPLMVDVDAVAGIAVALLD
jgi:hypothetical protein